MTKIAGEGAAFRKLLRLGLEISRVYGSPLEHGASPDGPAHDRDQQPEGDMKRAVVSGQPQRSPVQVKQFCVAGSAEARGALDHRVQHGLEIRRRLTDDAQDLS